MGDLGFTQRSW